MKKEDDNEFKSTLPIDEDIPTAVTDADANDEAVKEEVEKPTIDAEMMATIKSQIMAELATEQEKKVALAAEERKKAAAERLKYVEKMKKSKEPWVDIIGNVSDGDGVGIELDWNDAFIDFLRAQGINGTDDDQVVQKYITLLLRDMADTIDEEQDPGSEFEG